MVINSAVTLKPRVFKICNLSAPQKILGGSESNGSHSELSHSEFIHLFRKYAEGVSYAAGIVLGTGTVPVFITGI